MLQSKDTKNRDRVKYKKLPPIGVASWSAVGTDLTIVFDQPVRFNGTPNYSVNVLGANVVSAALSNPTTIVVTYDIDISLATQITIPFEEPSVRNPKGGFVNPTTVAA